MLAVTEKKLEVTRSEIRTLLLNLHIRGNVVP